MKVFFKNYRNWLCIAISAVCILLSFLVFNKAIPRLWESCKDFASSIVYYFCFLFDLEYTDVPPMSEFSTVLTAPVFLPDNWEGFTVEWHNYWQRFTDRSNLDGYIQLLGEGFYNIALFLTLIMPFVILLILLFHLYMEKQTTEHNKDSKSLQKWRQFTLKVWQPCKNWLIESKEFLQEHSYWWKIWLTIWALNFNLITIAVELVAYYFYFVASFDFLNVYKQVYKLFVDLSVMVNFVPAWAWVGVIAFIFDKIRKKMGLQMLRHYENRNKGFINERPLVTMVVGTMGKGKTTVITDMALSEEAILRDKAFELIIQNDLRFPYFPWIILEKEVRRAMTYHQIYNLATCRKFIQKKRQRWEKTPCREKIFDYRYEQYGLYHEDNLKVESVWEVLERYMQLYFIYIIESSIILSNYSIRTDAMLCDYGNFPIWNNDFFSRDARVMEAYSRHSKILDFDVLRLGRKVIEDNPYKDAFEFGVVAITEIGKERKNMLELQGTKRKDEETNQKNDLFNIALKMIRHPATIDGFPFVKIITDEQRPESWGSDARDLCEIVTIMNTSETDIAMPFFEAESMFYEWLFYKFQDLYCQYRVNRGDNSLPIYFIKSVTAKVYGYYRRLLNLYGAKTCRVMVEAGTQNGRKNKRKYYLMSKKIYSNRFSTDCYKGFFEEKALRSGFGIMDLPEYETEVATMSELKQQNSYFIGDLTQIKDNFK